MTTAKDTPKAKAAAKPKPDQARKPKAAQATRKPRPKPKAKPRKRPPTRTKPVRDDLSQSERVWLDLGVNQPNPEKDLPAHVGNGSHNPLQGRPF